MARGNSVRIPIHDRPWISVQPNAVFAPLTPPTPDAVRDRLAALVRANPRYPLGARRVGNRWQFLVGDELDRHLASLVVDQRGLGLMSPDLAAADLLAEVDNDLPLRVVLGTNWLAVSYSHVLADGATAALLVAAVLDLPGATDEFFAHVSQPQPNLLGQAWRGFYLRHPSRLRATLRTPRPSPPEVDRHDQSTAPAEPPFVIAARLSPQAEAELNGSRAAASLSEPTALFLAARRAIADAGLLPDTIGAVILMDARCYLPAGAVTANFVEGVYFDAETLADPQLLRDRIRQTRRDGRLLASLTLTTARACLASTWPMTRVAKRDEQAAPTVSFAHLGALSPVETIPWTSDEVTLIQASAPAGPGSMSWSFGRLGGALHVTATCALPADARARVQAAVDAVVSAPAELLERAA